MRDHRVGGSLSRTGEGLDLGGDCCFVGRPSAGGVGEFFDEAGLDVFSAPDADPRFLILPLVLLLHVPSIAGGRAEHPRTAKDTVQRVCAIGHRLCRTVRAQSSHLVVACIAELPRMHHP